VSLDGFHLYRKELTAVGMERRGAPWTFDSLAIIKTVRALRDNKGEVLAPTFDHAVKDPEQNGVRVPTSAPVVIIEHNYVLLDEPVWRDITSLVDVRVFVDTPLHICIARVRDRRQRDIGEDSDTASRRARENDRRNGLRIRRHRVGPVDVLFRALEAERATTSALTVHEQDDELSSDEISDIDDDLVRAALVTPPQ